MKVLKKIVKVSNNFINVFLVVLTLISVLGATALISPNFISLSANNVHLILIVALLGGLLWLFRRKVRPIFAQLVSFLSKNLQWIFIVMGVIVVVCQVYFVYSLSGMNMWDPSGLIARAMGTPNMAFPAKAYLSTYPNNFLLFLFEKGVWVIFGQPKVATLSLILSLNNVFIVDFSIILLSVSLKALFNRRVVACYLFLSLIFMGFSPWISVPYSDVWGFCLSSISIALLIKLFFSSVKWKRIAYSVLTGATIFGSYYMKPSLIILYMGAGIVLVVSLVARKKVTSLLSLGIIAITFVALAVGFSTYKNNNSIIDIDNRQTFSLFHFAAMGIEGNGGYYGPDVEIDRSIKNPEQRKERDIKVVKQRMMAFKAFGNYFKFLVKKQAANTADGTFTWGYSGNMVYYHPTNNFLQIMFTPKRILPKNTMYTLVIQILWSGVLLFILCTAPNQRLFVQILKYSVVGFFCFLLIFEGGRSRYLIQAFPVLILLSSVGFDNFISMLKLKRPRETEL